MSDPQEGARDKSFGDVVQETQQEAPEQHAIDTVFKSALDSRYPDLKLSKEQAGRVREFVGQMRLGGAGGIRLICAGDNCEYRAACPLWQTKDGPPVQVPDPDDPTGQQTVPYQPTKAPVGEPCPLEATVAMDTRLQMSAHSAVDTSNPVHRAYVNELVLLAALEWRVNMLLAFDLHSVTQEVPAAISPSGDVYTKREMNQLIEVLGRINDRRSKIMRELTVSPESEYKRRVAEGEKEGESQARSQAATMEKIREAERAPAALPVPEHVTSDPAYRRLTGSTDGQTEPAAKGTEESPAA